MIYTQLEAIDHVCVNSNKDENGEPIIKVGDLLLFIEEDKSKLTYINYDTFFKAMDNYFEYTIHGKKESQTIKITGILTKFMNM